MRWASISARTEEAEEVVEGVVVAERLGGDELGAVALTAEADAVA